MLLVCFLVMPAVVRFDLLFDDYYLDVVAVHKIYNSLPDHTTLDRNSL